MTLLTLSIAEFTTDDAFDVQVPGIMRAIQVAAQFFCTVMFIEPGSYDAGARCTNKVQLEGGGDFSFNFYVDTQRATTTEAAIP